MLVSPFQTLGSHSYWPTSQLSGKLSNLNQYQMHFYPLLHCFQLGLNFPVALFRFLFFLYYWTVLQMCAIFFVVFFCVWGNHAIGKTTSIQAKKNNKSKNCVHSPHGGDCGQEIAMDFSSCLKKKVSRDLTITTTKKGWSSQIKLESVVKRGNYRCRKRISNQNESSSVRITFSTLRKLNEHI